MLGSQDLLIVLALGLIFFGAKKLSELERGLGESLKEFKRATTESDPPPPPTPGVPSAPAVAAPPGRGCPSCQDRLRSVPAGAGICNAWQTTRPQDDT
jgi:sec-independent protein translocase protein TatA